VESKIHCNGEGKTSFVVKRGFIKHVETIEWVSPMVLTLKKNN
jgi:hypothetical protein